MNKLAALAASVLFAAPAAAQEEFLEFAATAEVMRSGGKSVENESTHFTIHAPAGGGLLLGSQAEKIWT